MRRALLLVVAGCAQGGRDVSIDASTGLVDAPKQQMDAPAVDAPPGTQTRELTQTTSQTIQPQSSIACANNPPGTNSNNYYRVFDLAALGITSPFKVTEVTFQIEHSDQINGTAGSTVAVRVGTYAGTPSDVLELSMMTVLASNPTVAVPEVISNPGPPPTTPGGTVHAPISATIPAGQKLFIEVDSPDGHNQYYFYMGANTAGETAPGYVLAPTCVDGNQMPISKPTNISKVAPSVYPKVNLLLSVTGQYQP
ncbi:MAG TPA: hypothetical protein VMZ53_10775 [Kofleriaceae bacterium]|nr:hypothetical protein [Kofleriaceae bacterium]